MRYVDFMYYFNMSTSNKRWNTVNANTRLKELWKDPEWAAKQRAKIKAASPQLTSIAGKKRWANPQWAEEQKIRIRAGIKAFWIDPEKRANRIAKTKERFQDPIYKAAALAALDKGKAKLSTPEHKRKVSERWKNYWADPVRRAKHLASITKARQDPDYRAKCRLRWNSKCPDNCIYTRRSKTVAMHSWWEVAFAEWLDSKQIKWKYEPRYFEVGKSPEYFGSKYLPDFYLPDHELFIEIKGQRRNGFDTKFATMLKRYPDVCILLLSAKELKANGILDNSGPVLSSAARKRRGLLKLNEIK